MSKNSIQHQSAAPPPGQSLRRGSWTVGARFLIVVLLLGSVVLRASDSAAGLENKIKAGYLFNFGRFVEWPASAFPSPNSPFVIAVMGGGEATPVFEQLLAGKNIAGHPVQVKSVSAIPREAHILLVVRAAGRSPEELRGSLGSAPTLLVGETEQFAERGGSFGFVREEESIKLTLCLEHAAAAGLKVSSKLSTVAKAVKSKRGK